jgi:hypothetical protein
MNPSSQAENSNLALADVVFAGDKVPVFAVLDGASVPKLLNSLYEHKPEFCCLYPGELNPDMAAMAPYLVRLEAGKEFTSMVLTEGWGAHWGVFVVSARGLRTLRDHFRQFHKVELPDQRTVIFRYYDPRVFRIFLPICNEAELAQFFGPVQTFVVEGETPATGVKFIFGARGLKTEPFRSKTPS